MVKVKTRKTKKMKELKITFEMLHCNERGQVVQTIWIDDDAHELIGLDKESKKSNDPDERDTTAYAERTLADLTEVITEWIKFH